MELFDQGLEQERPQVELGRVVLERLDVDGPDVRREAAALEAKQRAEAVIAGKTAEFEYAKAQAELADAVAKLRAIENLRNRTAR